MIQKFKRWIGFSIPFFSFLIETAKRAIGFIMSDRLKDYVTRSKMNFYELMRKYYKPEYTPMLLIIGIFAFLFIFAFVFS